MISEYFKKIYYHWKILLKDRTFVVSLLIGLLVLIGAYYVSFALSIYREILASNYMSVGDFILDDIPTYNLRVLDVWGFVAILVSIFAYTFFYKPEIAPFAMKTFGILILVRAFFIMMTNIGPPN
ncbi:hypothetical protein GF366_03125, partial [Candidatus Peregrinibacteria bacterium]|nr:hypothetical protein [Candidatus Peregrinibacteria bacterium]